MIARFAVTAAAAALCLAAPAAAQDVAGFYKGKQIVVLVGTGPGTTYDIYAHTLAEHMGRHLPGAPNFIVQGIPGAGGAKAAQMLYNTVAKDGTYLAVLQPNLVLSAVLDEQKPLFEYAKFGQIGGFAAVNGMLSVWTKAPATTLEDAKKVELFMGTTGPGSDTYQAPKLANALLGTKFKVLSGYKDVGEMELAMERGELHGRGGSVLSWTSRKPDWISGAKIAFLFQMGPKADPAIPNVPLLQDLVQGADAKQIVAFFNAPTALGRGVMTTPNVPAERLKALRDAFAATMKDARFLADAKTRILDIDPLTAEELEKTVAEATSLTPELAAKARETQK
ncbi:MAG: Bug family tripartite tricarboxylate transporter substrate binding protein [Alphaproteobacteria bacterium]